MISFVIGKDGVGNSGVVQESYLLLWRNELVYYFHNDLEGLANL